MATAETNLFTDRSGWETFQFREFAENISDRIDDPASAGVDRYVGLEHLDPNSLTIRRWGHPSEVSATKLLFRRGDIIFGRRRAYQRKLGIADFDGICSAHALVLRAREDVVLPEFLPLFLQSDAFFSRALRISVGSLSPTINWRTLAKQEFVLPPKPTQHRLAELLWQAERAQLGLESALEQAENLARAITARFLGSQISSQTLPCSEICHALTVGIVVRPASYYVENGIPALRSLNVRPGRIKQEDLVYISEEGHRAHPKSALSPGDVVIVRSGRPGDAAVVDDSIAGANCIDLLIARPRADVRPEYLAAFLNSPLGKGEIKKRQGGTAQQHLNVRALARIEVPLPDLAHQDALLEHLRGLDRAAVRIVDQLNSLQLAKAILREELFTS